VTTLDAPALAVDEMRERFADGFQSRCDSIAVLMDSGADRNPAVPTPLLHRVLHQMIGLAGTIGFPSVSDRARDLDEFLAGVPHAGFDRVAAAARLQALRDALSVDADLPSPGWSIQTESSRASDTILIVEDDHEQQQLMTGWLKQAGYRVVCVAAGEEVSDAARSARASAILLNVDLPGIDGYETCRRLKTSDDLSSLPVMFLTAHRGKDDRLTGLALGADDYLQKPIDPRELVLRLTRLVSRSVPPARAQPSTGRSRPRLSVVLAEDNPLVMRILDATMRAAHYDTVDAFDGSAALHAVETQSPDLLILDLMMPKMTGFEVLARLRHVPSRPKVIVLSARGREDDVTKAFDLGADDYMTKPFSPHELMARVERLLR
jgi:DNA-binding response OmpR family regulator